MEWVAAAPIEGGLASIQEIAGLDQLQAAGVPISVAAGNGSLNVDRLPLGLAGAATPDMLVAAAADTAGNLQPYSHYGARMVSVALELILGQ